MSYFRMANFHNYASLLTAFSTAGFTVTQTDNTHATIKFSGLPNNTAYFSITKSSGVDYNETVFIESYINGQRIPTRSDRDDRFGTLILNLPDTGTWIEEDQTDNIIHVNEQYEWSTPSGGGTPYMPVTIRTKFVAPHFDDPEYTPSYTYTAYCEGQSFTGTVSSGSSSAGHSGVVNFTKSFIQGLSVGEHVFTYTVVEATGIVCANFTAKVKKWSMDTTRRQTVDFRVDTEVSPYTYEHNNTVIYDKGILLYTPLENGGIVMSSFYWRKKGVYLPS